MCLWVFNFSVTVWGSLTYFIILIIIKEKRRTCPKRQGSDAGRGAAWTWHGQRCPGQRGVAGGPGTPESGLVSKEGFQDERHFWPSVPKLSRFGPGVSLEGAYHHPTLPEGIGACLAKPVVPWAVCGPDSEPLPARSFRAVSRSRAQHSSLFAAPLWVARASRCPSTIAVAELLWGKWGRKPRSRPAAPHSQLPALPDVPGRLPCPPAPSGEAEGWTSRQHHRPWENILWELLSAEPPRHCLFKRIISLPVARAGVLPCVRHRARQILTLPLIPEGLLCARRRPRP